MPSSDPMIYIDGRFTPRSQATMRVDDRGTLYADGVYEVLRYYAGRPFELDLHLQRLSQSLEKIRIQPPEDFERAPQILQELVEQNQLADARVYWQITRGAAPRGALFPKGVKPTVLMTADPVPGLDPDAPVPTLTATLMPDERWANCWIKCLMLLPNVLAHNAANEAGFDAAILHRDTRITEATNANAFIVINGELWTHPADRWILNGVTRQVLIELAKQLNLPVREECFTSDQLCSADEVLLTGTTLHVAAVTHIEHQPIGDAKPGPITRQLHEAFIQHVLNTCVLNAK